jgi:hypothetical protein
MAMTMVVTVVMVPMIVMMPIMMVVMMSMTSVASSGLGARCESEDGDRGKSNDFTQRFHDLISVQKLEIGAGTQPMVFAGRVTIVLRS